MISKRGLQAGTILLGFALGLSVYLAWTSLAGGAVAGCSSTGGDCHSVLSSRWGSVLGLPVSLMGIPIYGALLLLAFRKSRAARRAVETLSLLVIGAALWFGAVQLIILQAFCPWCCTTHACAVGGVIVHWIARRRGRPTGLPGLPWALASPALLGMVVLQALGPAPAETQRLSLGSAGGARGGTDSMVSLHDGRFVLDASEFPTIGSPTASRVAVALTDYTCGYCRKLHGQLSKAVSAYPEGQLCVIELPVARTEDAAEIQRLMLAIWRVDPAARAQLERKIHSRRLPVDPASIRAAAESLLGVEQLDNALRTHRDWADLKIQLAAEILEANREATGVAHLPQLVVGDEVSIGASSDVQEYLGLFEQHLDLAPPSREALAAAEAESAAGHSVSRAPATIHRPPSGRTAPPQFRAAGEGGAPPAIPAGYFTWMLEHFAMPDEIALAAPDFNPDDDAEPNGVEYWCRLNPRAHDAHALEPRLDADGRLTLALQLRDNDPELLGFVEFSNDLHFEQSSTIAFASLQPTDPDPGDGLLSWLATDPLRDARLQRFARAQFEIAWPRDSECVSLCGAAASRLCQSDALKLREFFHLCLEDCVEGRCNGESRQQVCGCDGITYDSACAAAEEHASIEHSGPCGLPPCDSNADCSQRDYCASEGCGEPGVCSPRPFVCPRNYDPVCGCDGKTYGNSCEAAAAGVNIAHDGVCAGSPCHSIVDCGNANYCAFEKGCDGPGVCRPRPDACPDVYDPVCGCDGKTYGNSCEAAAAGMNIAHEGVCAEECRSNSDCARADYCELIEGCDGPGVCQPRPQACLAIWDPVCGCDGVTYGNACEAAAAGVNVASGRACRIHNGP